VLCVTNSIFIFLKVNLNTQIKYTHNAVNLFETEFGTPCKSELLQGVYSVSTWDK
jgi:hypothetical protein